MRNSIPRWSRLLLCSTCSHHRVVCLRSAVSSCPLRAAQYEVGDGRQVRQSTNSSEWPLRIEKSRCWAFVNAMDLLTHPTARLGSHFPSLVLYFPRTLVSFWNHMARKDRGTTADVDAIQECHVCHPLFSRQSLLGGSLFCHVSMHHHVES